MKLRNDTSTLMQLRNDTSTPVQSTLLQLRNDRRLGISVLVLSAFVLVLLVLRVYVG